MKRALLWKGLTVGGLALLLLLPLYMIEGLIVARSGRQRAVEANIAQTSVGRQRLIGPLLALDYTVKQDEWVRGEQGRQGAWEAKTVARTLLLPPRQLTLEGAAQVEPRYRGLYKAQVFRMEGVLRGELAIPQSPALPSGLRELRWGKAHLVFAVSDLRGIQGHPKLRWHERELGFRLVKTVAPLGRCLGVELGEVQELLGQTRSFEIPDFQLTGTQELSVAPVAEDTQIQLSSTWASPSFGGQFLPVHRSVTSKGFEARWQVPGLARDLEGILEARGGGDSSLSVSFVEPVNIYLQTERATKYGILFVGLVFAAFFFFEILRRLPLHPMQYLLVGVSLALFFLLLLSLSEHMPFLWAYVTAGGASVLLLGFYLAGVLRSRTAGMGFSGALVLLYGVLYGILASEDNALLMGSALLFAVLAGIMAATRRLDWYGIGQSS